MPFMKGPAPIRRTLKYLEKCDLYFKKNVRIMSVNYNVDQKSSIGAYEFAFWHFPKIQYRNPDVQILKFKNITPTPFIQIFFDNGEKCVVDIYGKTKDEIYDHIKNTFCHTEDQIEAAEKEMLVNPANFGEDCSRYCICEIPGQVPCPSYVPIPKHMKGIRKQKMDNVQEDT